MPPRHRLNVHHFFLVRQLFFLWSLVQHMMGQFYVNSNNKKCYIYLSIFFGNMLLSKICDDFRRVRIDTNVNVLMFWFYIVCNFVGGGRLANISTTMSVVTIIIYAHLVSQLLLVLGESLRCTLFLVKSLLIFSFFFCVWVWLALACITCAREWILQQSWLLLDFVYCS